MYVCIPCLPTENSGYECYKYVLKKWLWYVNVFMLVARWSPMPSHIDYTLFTSYLCAFSSFFFVVLTWFYFRSGRTTCIRYIGCVVHGCVRLCVYIFHIYIAPIFKDFLFRYKRKSSKNEIRSAMDYKKCIHVAASVVFFFLAARRWSFKWSMAEWFIII